MKHYLNNFEYTLNSKGKVLWARDIVSGRFVKLATVQALHDAKVKQPFDAIDAVMILCSLFILLMAMIPLLFSIGGIDNITALIAIIAGYTLILLCGLTWLNVAYTQSNLI